MKVLFIGGTGNISTSVSRLCIQKGIDLYLLNRGNRKRDIEGAQYIKGDISSSEAANALKGHQWDAVVNWIAFTPEHIERDIKLFTGKTSQYIFISSASIYQKPATHPIITESTPLHNPYWDYSRNKIACEDRLNREYRENNFPITVVRPSHTYDTVIPVPFGGWEEYTIIDRMKKGKKVIIHGDGTSLWVMTHAEDFAKGFTGLIGNRQANGHAFQITSDEVLTWNQIFEAIAEAAGTPLNAVHIASDFISDEEESLRAGLIGDKSQSVIFDNTKIKTFVPGYVATIPFSVGIKRTIDWFHADPSRQIIKQETNDMFDRIINAYEKRK